MSEIFQIILSLITGAYSGFIVAMYSEFRSLREEASRVILNKPQAIECARELEFISSSMRRLGHEKSAERLAEISKSYKKIAKENKIIGDNEEVNIPSIEGAKKIIDQSYALRRQVSNLSPSWPFLLFPFWREKI